jgi:ubiquinone biosynthesis protein Coq4
MATETFLAPRDPLGYARWLWQGYLELLEDPDGYDEVFVLAEAEEWPLFVEALARLAQSDPAAAMALVDEVMARAEELRALGVRLEDREAFLKRLGL